MKEIINQIFAIKKKASKNKVSIFDRNIDRLFHEFEALGYLVIDPIGKPYKNEMTDVDAKVATEGENMKIVKVLKPIIYDSSDKTRTKLLQKGIVIVE